MSYIENSLGSDETVVAIFSLHWTVWIWTCLFALPALIGWLLVAIAPIEDSQSAAFFLGLYSLLPLYMVVQILTTELGLSTRRIITKKGWVSRSTNEMRLSKVETVEVSQGFLGRILGYGSVKVTGTGSGAVRFPGVEDPLDVKRKIEDQLELA